MFNAIGMKPSDATNAVVSTGRKRVNAPSNMASLKLKPFFLNSLIKETITNPFKMAIPDRAIKPTAAEIEKGMSRNISAKIPPVRASGTPVKMIMASLKEPSANNRILTIITSVAGTTMLNLCVADCSF